MAGAAAPPNDVFSSRIRVSAAAYSITTSNVDATIQTGENTMMGEFGATLWWQWTAPTSGWVNFNTWDSDVDTVMRVTSSAQLNGSLFGFNDDEIPSFGASSLTFQVASGQVLYICVGGYDDGLGADEGQIVFSIRTGAAAQPELWIASSSFSPSTVNVTAAARTSVFSATMAGTQGTKGTMDIGTFVRMADSTTINLATIAGANFAVGATPATRTIQVPRYVAGGGLQPTVVIETEDGDIYEWGNAGSGLPYLMNMPTLTVQNTGPSDSLAPVLSAFTINSRNVNVNSSAVTLQVSMTLTDNLSGLAEVSAYLFHPLGAIYREITLTPTTGTPTSGTWTGNVTLPKEYPTASYDVYIELVDQARNFRSYGDLGEAAMPGGDVFVNVNGGGPYWLWAYEQMEDSQVGLDQDPSGDGLDNLTCYAFGLDPFSTVSSLDLPIITVNGAGRLEMEYFRRVAATGLSYMPQFSNDMKSWGDFSGTVTVVGSDFPGWDTVTLEDTATSLANRTRFARMKLTYVDP
jgi:hypothetical protein